MHGVLVFVHVASFAVWLGASLTFMVWGPSAAKASLEVWAHTWITLATLQRAIVAPMAVVTLVTGTLLSLGLVQNHVEVSSMRWLVMMQAFGALAVLVTLVGATPLANRMSNLAARSLEKKVKDPAAEVTRKRLAVMGSFAGLFILIALYFSSVRAG